MGDEFSLVQRDHSFAKGVLGEVGDGVYVELVHEVLAVFLHCLDGHVELVCNLFR